MLKWSIPIAVVALATMAGVALRFEKPKTSPKAFSAPDVEVSVRSQQTAPEVEVASRPYVEDAPEEPTTSPSFKAPIVDQPRRRERSTRQTRRITPREDTRPAVTVAKRTPNPTPSRPRASKTESLPEDVSYFPGRKGDDDLRNIDDFDISPKEREEITRRVDEEERRKRRNRQRRNRDDNRL